MGDAVGLFQTDINGIEAQGFGNGSGVSAQPLRCQSALVRFVWSW